MSTPPLGRVPGKGVSLRAHDVALLLAPGLWAETLDPPYG